MMLVKSPIQCLAQKKWDCLMAGSTRGSPQYSAFRVPPSTPAPLTRPPPPLPPHSWPPTAPGRERGRRVPVGRIYRSELAMGGPPAVDAGAEKREGEPNSGLRGRVCKPGASPLEERWRLCLGRTPGNRPGLEGGAPQPDFRPGS